MSKNWYKKSMPTVKQVQSFIKDIAKTINGIDGVKEVRVWGSFVQNIKIPSFVLKDIDLIAVNDFYSEDLLSISDTTLLKTATQELEESGFDLKTVHFTRKYTSLKQYNIDHWAISSDNKLLHWGAIPSQKEDWEEIKIQAEKYASFMTGINRSKLNNSSQTMKNKWSLLYDHSMNKNLSGMPHGWYCSNADINKTLMETIII